MSPTEQERAEAIFIALCKIGQIERGGNRDAEVEAIKFIASAIRQAENDAYERAAIKIAQEDDAAFAHMTAPTARECVEIIRALKSKEP